MIIHSLADQPGGWGRGRESGDERRGEVEVGGELDKMREER